MKVAVIISTYNWPEALNLCLASLAKQSRVPDQVVIGDDGSSDATKAVIEAWRDQLNIIHEWQEDLGFRLARSRNISLRKDTGQRVKAGCGCTVSVDIGSYRQQPCYHNCLFCYANPASGIGFK